MRTAFARRSHRVFSPAAAGNTNNASGQLVGDGNSPGISFGLNVGGYKELDVTLASSLDDVLHVVLPDVFKDDAG